MRIELVKDAVKNLVVDVLPTKIVVEDAWLRFREGISGAFKESRTVYVATFWHVDSMSGLEWNIDLDDVAGVFSKWVNELEEAVCDGVIGLYEVEVPYPIYQNREDIQEFIEELGADDLLVKVLDTYRVGLDESAGF